MSREMDAKIAEWMGYVWLYYNGPEEEPYSSLMSPEDAEWCNRNDVYVISNEPVGHKKIGGWVPLLSTDRNAMSKAEDMVRDRGLGQDYAQSLAWVLDLGWEMWHDHLGWRDVIALATATAGQRAAALCRVIDQETT